MGTVELAGFNWEGDRKDYLRGEEMYSTELFEKDIGKLFYKLT